MMCILKNQLSQVFLLRINPRVWQRAQLDIKPIKPPGTIKNNNNNNNNPASYWVFLTTFGNNVKKTLGHAVLTCVTDLKKDRHRDN